MLLNPVHYQEKNPCLNLNSSFKNAAKSAVALTSIAIGTFASYSLLRYNFGIWSLTAISVTVFSLCSLPKLLKYGNFNVVKWTLITNLVGLGSLFLGLVAGNCLNILRIYTFEVVKQSGLLGLLVGHVFVSPFLTALLGYIVPLAIDPLKRGYSMIVDPHLWEERIKYLHAQFQILPESRRSLALFLCLFQPSNTLSNPGMHATAMIEGMSLQQRTLEHFAQNLKSIEQMAGKLNVDSAVLPEQIKDEYYQSLKIRLEFLEDHELKQAAALFLVYGLKSVPQLLSPNHFFDFFSRPKLLNIANQMIEQFLNQYNSWSDLYSRFESLRDDLKAFEQTLRERDLKNLSAQEKTEFTQHHENIIQRFQTLRKEIETSSSNWRIWRTFIPLLNKKDHPIFQNEDQLLKIMDDQLFSFQIEDVFFSLIGSKENHPLDLSQNVQFVNEKMKIFDQNEEEEPATSVMYLAANKGFVQRDFEVLQKKFNLENITDLEEAMTLIGLSTEKDLYDNAIIFKSSDLSKIEIQKNLDDYITHALLQKKSIIIKNEIPTKAPVQSLIHKVSRTFYYLLTNGYLLAPAFFNPRSAMCGFGVGAAIFAFKYFNFPRIHTTLEAANHMIPNRVFLPAFDDTSERREEANQFVNANFFQQMRILNKYTRTALLQLYFSKYFAPWQGYSVARRIFNF